MRNIAFLGLTLLLLTPLALSAGDEEGRHQRIVAGGDLSKVEAPGDRVQLEIARGAGVEAFTARLDGREIGGATVRFLDVLTDGSTLDIAYLSRIRLDEGYRGQGFGSALLRLVAGHLWGQGLAWLHTDTGGNNVVAQRFYESLGFEDRGFFRSYIRDN